MMSLFAQYGCHVTETRDGARDQTVLLIEAGGQHAKIWVANMLPRSQFAYHVERAIWLLWYPLTGQHSEQAMRYRLSRSFWPVGSK